MSFVPYRPFSQKFVARLIEHDDVIKHCSEGLLSLALGPAPARAGSGLSV